MVALPRTALATARFATADMAPGSCAPATRRLSMIEARLAAVGSSASANRNGRLASVNACVTLAMGRTAEIAECPLPDLGVA